MKIMIIIAWIYIAPFTRPKVAFHSRINATQPDKNKQQATRISVCCGSRFCPLAHPL